MKIEWEKPEILADFNQHSLICDDILGDWQRHEAWNQWLEVIG